MGSNEVEAITIQIRKTSVMKMGLRLLEPVLDLKGH